MENLIKLLNTNGFGGVLFLLGVCVVTLALFIGTRESNAAPVLVINGEYSLKVATSVALLAAGIGMGAWFF